MLKICSLYNLKLIFPSLGYAFVKNKPSVIESWNLSPIYPFIDDFKNGIDASIVEAIANEKPEFRKDVELIDKNWWEICQNAFFFKEKRFLTHADSWLNNIFFSVDDCKLLDWQALSLNHPVIGDIPLSFINAHFSGFMETKVDLHLQTWPFCWEHA